MEAAPATEAATEAATATPVAEAATATPVAEAAAACAAACAALSRSELPDGQRGSCCATERATGASGPGRRGAAKRRGGRQSLARCDARELFS